MPEIPPMTRGVVYRDGENPIPGVGEPGLQARVARDGRVGLFDDMVGPGFAVISTVSDPADALTCEQRDFLAQLRSRVMHIAPVGTPAELVDIDGNYDEYLRQRGWEVVVTRPDYYVFAGGALADLPRMVDTLAARVEARVHSPATGSQAHNASA
jgi:hypothetical protein